MLVKLGKRAWLHCDDCRHSIMIEPHELAQRHQLDMQTPLLMIARQWAVHAEEGCCPLLGLLFRKFRAFFGVLG